MTKSSVAKAGVLFAPHASVAASLARSCGVALTCAMVVGCATTLPEPKRATYTFPKNAFVGDVKNRPYEKLGLVRTKVDFQTLDPNYDENELCRNYYNKAAGDLVKRAKEVGADAVIDVRSVVFYEDGRHSTHQTPECSDDGMEGQILTQGIAVRWKGDSDPSVNEQDFAAAGGKPLKKKRVPPASAAPSAASGPSSPSLEPAPAEPIASEPKPKPTLKEVPERAEDIQVEVVDKPSRRKVPSKSFESLDGDEAAPQAKPAPQRSRKSFSPFDAPVTR